jgi:hypothetical protein
MPFHGKNRQDFVIWRTTYSGIQPDQFDLDNPDHEKKLGYGRAIMFFTCKVRPSELEIKHLVFMEEVWRYTAPKPRLLGRRIQVSSLLQHATQPCVLRARQNPNAVSETKTGDGKGSPLYRLNMWYMRWGDTKQAVRMVRRFAKKDTC